LIPLPQTFASIVPDLRHNGNNLDSWRCWYVLPPRNFQCRCSGGANTDFLYAVARIAYIASDVVISVQPSLAVDSEFSKDLRSFAETKAPSLVAKGVAEVYFYLPHAAAIASNISITDRPSTIQCRPIAFRPPISPIWKNHLRNHNLLYSPTINSTSIQARAISSRPTCIITAIQISRLL
jgi:hypothetical protein